MNTNQPRPLNPAEAEFFAAYFARRTTLTYCIIAANILVFAVLVYASPQRVSAFQSGSDYQTLINFGAKTNFWLLAQHQWFRFVTPIFLHIGIMHVGLNMYSLWQIGGTVERFFGAARYALIYLLAGIGGVIASAISVIFARQDGASAGASGAIFGLLGVLITLTYKSNLPIPDFFRRALRKDIVTLVILNLAFGFINNFSARASSQGPLTQHYISNAAHLGGLCTGAFLCWVLPTLPVTCIIPTRAEKIMLGLLIAIVVICYWQAYLLRPFAFLR